MQSILLVLQLLAQTAEQKNTMLVGFGCVAVFFMIMCMDKSSFKGRQFKIMLSFLAIFIVIFVVLYFFVV